jgi:hypothetical protein
LEKENLGHGLTPSVPEVFVFWLLQVPTFHEISVPQKGIMKFFPKNL